MPQSCHGLDRVVGSPEAVLGEVSCRDRMSGSTSNCDSGRLIGSLSHDFSSTGVAGDGRLLSNSDFDLSSSPLPSNLKSLQRAIIVADSREMLQHMFHTIG